ncbi:hypothetical protein [Taibaiella sp. KBW10]|uniref:hypothetical protein n=1 Tax=Taibaiella sp. KBW10 TaxID=2153357 RepID=UPI000F5A2007|nr:hypothetical protein [Taibaiella sp. KBW10]
MKKTFISFASVMIFLLIASVVWISCQKDEKIPGNTKGLSTQAASNIYFPSYAGAYDQLQAISLHRYGGFSKITHKGCNCVSCFGACIERIFLGPAPFDASISYNFIMERVGSSTARLYFIQAPDVEVTVDPMFYVDHDILVVAGNQQCTILAAAYQYNNTAGTATLGGVNFHYHGTTIVNLAP